MDNIKIIAFSGDINSVEDTLNQINSIRHDGEIIQLVNADSIVCKNQLIHGVNQALLAFKRGENLAKDISVEIVLRCSAQRQISKAFDMLGLKEGNMNLYVVLINSKDYTKELSTLFTLHDGDFDHDEESLIDLYDICDSELQKMSLEEIIIDRITKLTVDY